MRVVVATGGSGGHLVPAISVVEALLSSGAVEHLLLAGTATAADTLLQGRLSSGAAVEALPLAVKPVRSPADLWRLGRGYHEALKRLKQFRPDVTIGFGSYASVPVAAAALRLGCPLLIHEQNVYPGLANRWLARWARVVAVSHEQTRRYLPANGHEVVVTGNPTIWAGRRIAKQDALRTFGFAADRLTLLVMGGSHGSSFINRRVTEMLEGWPAAERARWQVIHLAGVADALRINQAYDRLGLRHATYGFWSGMGDAYRAADVVIARAGATTLAELTLFGCPSILVPYPHASEHQSHNARRPADCGAAFVVPQHRCTAGQLTAWLTALGQHPALRLRMGAAARALAQPDAARRIVEHVTRLAGHRVSA